jgi:hypothetical protein
VVAVVLIVASAWLGVLVVDRVIDRSTGVEQPTPTPAASLPAADVEGEDLPDLGRYPGSVRTTYLREQQGSASVTIIDYVTTAELDDVRAFYRRIFRENEWELIELDFAGGEWVFLVESGNRVALVEIELGSPFTRIAIELEEPAPSPASSPTPTPTPTPPPPPPPPPDDDDDGFDD